MIPATQTSALSLRAISSLLCIRRALAAWCWISLLLGAGTGLPAAAPAKAEDEDVIEKPTTTETRPDPAAGKFWTAVRLLQSKKNGDLAAGRAALQALSDQEYTHAQVLLGNCLLSGSYGFAKDARKAVNLFRLAAERGNGYAKVSLGSCYATGTGAGKDDAKAMEWLNAALAPGADFTPPPRSTPVPGAVEEPGSGVAGEMINDPVSDSQATAHFILGQILTRQNKKTEAHTHFVAAATAGIDGRSGIYAAAVQAALDYAFGQGITRDPAKANEMLDQSRKLSARQRVSLIHNYVSLKMVDEFAVADLEESADQAGANDQSALQLNIAATLGNKKSKDYNLAEAVRWYELAADNGQVWAMLRLGLIYARSELGQPDPAKAFAWFEKAGGGDKPKHLLGVANLAICYQTGFGAPKNPAKASALFAKYKETDIICYLGSLGQCPAAPVTFEEALSLNETWAKQRNDRHAQYLLGRRYLYGWGVPVDSSEAQKWLKKAGKARHGAALCELGFIAENTRTNVMGYIIVTKEDLEKAVDYYRQGSNAGDPDAMANYANMLNEGRGVAKDEAKAEALFLQCLKIRPDLSRAHCNLAIIYGNRLARIVDTMDADNIRVTRALMLEHYETSHRLQNPYAARNLGNLYYEGKLVTRDFKKAYLYYEQAVEWGLPIVHYSLGYMHEFGQGVPITYTEAAYHYRLAALEGHLEALRRLTNFYLTGVGVSLDLDRAVFWLQQMARRGSTGVLPTLCDILLKKEDYAKVIPILRDITKLPQDALAGFAYDRLAICYREGRGVKADPARAEKYFKEALRRGNGDALDEQGLKEIAAGNASAGIATLTRAASTSRGANFHLGNMYYFGTNVRADRDLALKYLRAAAKLNHPDALVFLAVLAYNKEPGAPSLEDAIQFAQLAENSGHPKAADVREKLEKRRQSLDAAADEAPKPRS